MANIRFIGQNFVDLTTASISATSEVTTLPVENVQTGLRTQVWRTTGATSATVSIDLGQSYTTDSIAIISHNLSTDATVTYESATMASFATLLTQCTISVQDGVMFKFLDSQTARYHRINFQDADNTDGYVEMGRIFLGKYFEPEVNFHENYTTRLSDKSITTESEGNNYFSDEKQKRRELKLTWANPITLDLTDREGFEELFNYVGTSKDFILFMDYVNYPLWTYYGRFARDIEYRNVHSNDWYEISLDFSEAL